MDDYVDAIDLEVQKKPTWNVIQLFFAFTCFISTTALFKLPINFYFGSGWTLVMLIVFPIIFGGPFMYLQFSYGSIFKNGILGLMERNIPIGLIFTIGVCLRNLIHIILTSGIICHCITYIFFTIFNCDNKLCYGNPFPWSSCKDKWVLGDCWQSELTGRTPTTADNFYQNFILQKTPQIISRDNFPSWFDYPALITVPHLIGWLLIFLFVIGGTRVFGNLLYGIAPLAICSFFPCFVYSLINANSKNQWSKIKELFFGRFPLRVTVNLNEWDQYNYEPLIWGVLSTFVHLSVALHIWNNIYPILGKWVGYGKKRSYLCWLLIAIPFTVFVFLNVILWAAILSARFDINYMRCQVSNGFSFPFTVAAHYFSELGTHEAIVVFYYLSLLLFLVISESFLLMCTVETIVDHLRLWHEKIANNPIKSYRIFSVILVLIMYLLSLTTILKTGIHWMHLIDLYLDRFMCIIMFGQVGCILAVYALSKQPGLCGKTLFKIFSLIFLIIMALISFAVFIWYIVDIRSELPTLDCYHKQIDSQQTPIPYPYNVIGWLIALSSLVVGVILGIVVIVLHARRRGETSCGEVLTYCIHGEAPASTRQDILIPTGTTASHPSKSSNKKTKTGTWSSNFRQYDELPMVTTVMPGPSRSHGDIESSDAVDYMNYHHQKQPVNQPASFLYEQRHSLRRPLIPASNDSQISSGGGGDGDGGTSTTQNDQISQEYAKINKPKKTRRKPSHPESDV